MRVTIPLRCFKTALLPATLVFYEAAGGLPCQAAPSRSAASVTVQTSITRTTNSTGAVSTSKQQLSTGSTVSVISTANMDKPYGYHLVPILEKIGATAEQRRRISAIVQGYKPKIEPLREEYRQKSQEFLDCIIKGKPAEVIMARQGDLNNLYSVIVTQYSLMRLEVSHLLSPSQCRQLEQYRAAHGWRGK